MTDTIAIIPARAGSKSVKDKNIAMLDGHPLIAYSIMAAKLSQRVSRVLISTDSPAYAEIAKSYGAEVPFLRPDDLAGDKSGDAEFLHHAMDWLIQNEGQCPEYWVHLRPTTPLRDPVHIDEAVEQLKANPGASSLRSAHPAPESPFKWFRRDSNGHFVGLVESQGSDAHSKPKELFEQVYIPDGYVDVIRKSVARAQKNIHGEQIMSFISPVCTEVDSPQELDYLNWQVQRYPEHLKRALNNLRKED